MSYEQKHPFKVGDTVRCVDDSFCRYLRVGQEYPVLEVYATTLKVDCGARHPIYSFERFESVKPAPNAEYKTLADMPLGVECVLLQENGFPLNSIYERKTSGSYFVYALSRESRSVGFNLRMLKLQALEIPKTPREPQIWDEYLLGSNGGFKSNLYSYMSSKGPETRDRLEAAKAYVAWAEAGYPAKDE